MRFPYSGRRKTSLSSGVALGASFAIMYLSSRLLPEQNYMQHILLSRLHLMALRLYACQVGYLLKSSACNKYFSSRLQLMALRLCICQVGYLLKSSACNIYFSSRLRLMALRLCTCQVGYLLKYSSCNIYFSTSASCTLQVDYILAIARRHLTNLD